MSALPERFWAKVTYDQSGCLLWTGAISSNGYGCSYLKGVVRSAHSLAFEASFGPVPDGLEIDHLCRVRRCVNALHMEAVPHAENMRRRILAVCPRCGSPRTLQKSGQGRCQPCTNRSNRASYARRVAREKAVA